MRGHEPDVIDVRRIFRIAVIAIVVGAVIHIGVWWLFKYYRIRQERVDVRKTLIEIPPRLPPEPRLEVNPTEDWRTYRQAQQMILNSYGWSSREQRRARIPIDRAMELVVEQERKNGNR